MAGQWVRPLPCCSGQEPGDMWAKIGKFFQKALPYILDAVSYFAAKKQEKNEQQEGEVTPPEE